MNNNLKRFLSSVLAFVMLLSCMMVVNVSSVAAADVINSSMTITRTDNANYVTVNNDQNTSGAWKVKKYNDSSAPGYIQFTLGKAANVAITTGGEKVIYVGDTLGSTTANLTLASGTKEGNADFGVGTYYIYNNSGNITISEIVITISGETSSTTTTTTTTESTTEATTTTVIEEESSETTTATGTITWDLSTAIISASMNNDLGNGLVYVAGSSDSVSNGGIRPGGNTSSSNKRFFTYSLKAGETIKAYAVPVSSKAPQLVVGTYTYNTDDTYTLTQAKTVTGETTGTTVIEYTNNTTEIQSVYVGSLSNKPAFTKIEVIGTGSETPIDPTTYTVSVNVTDGTNAVSGATVKLGDTTLAESSTAGTYTATAITAGTVFTGLTVTATGYTDYTDTTERTINADTTIPVTLTATPTADPITVTVYDSSSREKIKGVVYYWTTTDGGSTTNEYKLVNSNAVIHVTEIANGTEAYLPTYSSGTNATNTPQSDMKDVLASATPKLYVTSEGYMGAEVTLPTSGNVNVLLTPLAEVNIATAGVYKVTANDIIAALLTSDANYAYQNPYINTAKVNGFTLSADANDTNQIFKIMQKVNTRNEYADKNNTARNLIQATDGCKIVYTPTVAGTLNISAASTSNSATGRGYTLDNVDNGTVSLTSTTAVLNTFDLTANTTYTMTVAGGINISSIEFVPSEVTKYSLTFKDDANGGGTATVTVGDTTLTSGTEYSFDENSEVKISVTPDTGKKATVKVNGTIVALAEDNTYSFALSGDNTSIEVTYADETAAEEVNTLTPIAIGETVDFSKETLKAQNTSLTSDKKAEYYADAVSGGGKTSVIKLKANDNTNYIKFVPAEDGNIAINFNSNPITVTGSDGSVVTLARATDGASNDVTRTMAVKAGVTYTITATSSGNAYVNSISLLASTVVAGNNIASIYDTEDLTSNTDILLAYDVTGTPAKAIRIIGQLKDITENNAADVDGAGVVILDCTIAEWKTSGLAESHIKGTLSVNKVYADVYNSADFDSSKVIDDTYTGNVKGLSELNSYFDLLVYADTATDFDGKAACAFTLVGDTKEYYNSNAELSGIDF